MLPINLERKIFRRNFIVEGLKCREVTNLRTLINALFHSRSGGLFFHRSSGVTAIYWTQFVSWKRPLSAGLCVSLHVSYCVVHPVTLGQMKPINSQIFLFVAEKSDYVMKAKNRNCTYVEINIRSSTDNAGVKYRSLALVPYQKTETLVMNNSTLLLLILLLLLLVVVVVVVVIVVVVANIETIKKES